MSLILIHPAPDALWADARLEGVLRHALAGREVRTLRRAEEHLSQAVDIARTGGVSLAELTETLQLLYGEDEHE